MDSGGDTKGVWGLLAVFAVMCSGPNRGGKDSSGEFRSCFAYDSRRLEYRGACVNLYGFCGPDFSIHCRGVGGLLVFVGFVFFFFFLVLVFCF